jgi:hypothetical protein
MSDDAGSVHRIPSSNDLVAAALDEAHKDWMARASAADTSPSGRLAAIFRDSGWSPRVDMNPNTGRPKDWCGMAVVVWFFRAGMNPLHRRSFWATANVRSFFSYGTAGRIHHRTATEVNLLRDSWVGIEAWHRCLRQTRRWVEGTKLHAMPLNEVTIAAGDVVLINHQGRVDGAHHIALVETWDGRVLGTLEGNATGMDPEGRRLRQGVVRVERDLGKSDVRKTVFGIGRVSRWDWSKARVR